MNPIKRWRDGAIYFGPIAVIFGFAAAVPCFAQIEKKPPVATGTVGLTYNAPVRGNPTGRVGGGTRSGGVERS